MLELALPLPQMPPIPATEHRGASRDERCEWPAALRLGAAARWGEPTVLEPAREYGRYLGPVFMHGDWIVQYLGDHCAVVHRASRIEWDAASLKLLAPGLIALNDRILAIYRLGDRGIAYPRGIDRSIRRRRVTATSCRAARQMGYGRRAAITGTVSLAVALALASCASHRLAMPNGRHRVAVNTADSVSRYEDSVARQDAMALEKSDLERKVDTLNAQVAALKAYAYAEQHKGSPASPSMNQMRESEKPARSSAFPISHEAAAASEAINVSPDDMIFRIHHPTGEVDFAPTAAIETDLLKAARAAKSIAIRGRTDSTFIDPLETQIALGRAIRAREYLVHRGVEPGKIRMWYRAAGDFIADNGAPIGRAENRRVDIETRGLKTASTPSPVAQTGRH